MADLSTGFENLERLEKVRLDYLNPTMRKVSEMEPKVTKLENDMTLAFNEVEFNDNTKKLKLTAPASSTEIDLTQFENPAPVPQTISVQSDGASPVSGVEILKFDEGLTVSTTFPVGQKPYATVRSPGPWARFGDRANFYPVKTFHFTGNVSLATVNNGLLTLDIPTPNPVVQAQIGTAGDSQEITKIVLEGNTAASMFDGSVLKINIPEEGGGGGPVDPTKFVQHFKGFYETLGDLISKTPASEVTNGKSYAFVKDSEFGGIYYTPYFYVNNDWTEMKQDPALTYNSPTSSNNQGVFSIKPNDKITIDINGQLDLSGLAAAPPEQDRWFHGFFESIQDLNSEVKNPILYKSTAYVRAPAPSKVVRMVTYKLKDDGSRDWVATLPVGALSLVNGSAIAPIFGIKNNKSVTIDNDGVLEIAEQRDVVLNCKIQDSSGTAVQGKFDTIEYLDGHSYVTVTADKTLIVNHPNRVITYSGDFEAKHKEDEYLGNIYFDRNDNYWMGRGLNDPTDMGGNKWSRIAYPKMAVDVKGLLRRLPQKASEVIPGSLGDNGKWENTGWTYMVPRTPTLPDEASETGGYIQTYVKDIEGETTIPQQRIQICYTDEEHPKTFMRRFDNTGTGSDPVWKPWYKASIGKEDLTHHDTDPQAHHELLRYYKVVTFDTTYTRLKAGKYRLPNSELMLIAESTGHTDSKWNPVTMPYDGNFKFNGRLSFDRFDTAAGKYPVGDWIFKVIKVDPISGSETVINTFSRTHNDVNKTFASMMWETGTIPLKKTDKIYFDIQFSNDKDFATLFDVGKFFVMRSYIVMQDENTTSGSLIAETFRKTLGNLNARENSGVTIHPQTVGSTNIRVYGEKVDNTYNPMTKT